MGRVEAIGFCSPYPFAHQKRVAVFVSGVSAWRMHDNSFSASSVVAIGLHVLGGVLAVAQIVAVAVWATGFAMLGGLSVVAIWVVGVLAAVATVGVCSGLGCVVANTARAAQAAEELVGTVKRLELEKTRDDGFYYRVR